MRQQKKIIDAITFVLQEQEERNEVLLLFSIQTVLTNAVEEENYEMAEKCRKIISKLTGKQYGSI
jgi:adenosyl cobinamide kinase/adenosyl cobinamide phosphate guanylyltransferase